MLQFWRLQTARQLWKLLGPARIYHGGLGNPVPLSKMAAATAALARSALPESMMAARGFTVGSACPAPRWRAVT